MCANVRPHPGPIIKSFSFCRWNLDSIMVDNKIKIQLIDAISYVHKSDIIALSETYLNDTIPNNEIEKEVIVAIYFVVITQQIQSGVVYVYTTRIIYRLTYVQTCIYLMNQLLLN